MHIKLGKYHIHFVKDFFTWKPTIQRQLKWLFVQWLWGFIYIETYRRTDMTNEARINRLRRLLRIVLEKAK